MQNPGFEQVSAASVPALSGFFSVMAQGATGWPIRQTGATTAATAWTTTTVYPEALYPPALVVGNGAYLGQTTSYGTRFALLPGWDGTRPQQIVGTLSSATTAGTTYVLSASVAKIGMPESPVVQLGLRNSATGAHSAPLVQAPGSLGIGWTRLSGTVSDGASYDQVVLRVQRAPYDAWHDVIYGSATWIGLADDLRLCKAVAASTGRPVGRWATARGAGAGVLLLVGLAWIARRRNRAHGRAAGTTGPG